MNITKKIALSGVARPRSWHGFCLAKSVPTPALFFSDFMGHIIAPSAHLVNPLREKSLVIFTRAERTHPCTTAKLARFLLGGRAVMRLILISRGRAPQHVLLWDFSKHLQKNFLTFNLEYNIIFSWLQ